MNNREIVRYHPDYLYAIDMTMKTVAESSARVYADTYKAWQQWSVERDLDPLAVHGGNVHKFLLSRDVALVTRRRMLSAMRSLAQVLVVLEPNNPLRQSAYQSVRMVKAPRKGAGGRERSQKALTPDEVERVFDVWLEDSLLHIRNQALITVMFASGVRRAELTALRWGDIHLDEGILHVRHGKGDKARYAALFGATAIHALEHWQSKSTGRDMVFCPLDKHGGVGADRAITADNLYRIVQQTGRLAGVDFKPHDARRSLATELLNLGMSPAEVQAQLGHAHASTTLAYAQAGSAAARRKAARLRWGR